MVLDNDKLTKVNGGIFKMTALKWLGLGSLGSFVIGFISGFLRPSTCKSGK